MVIASQSTLENPDTLALGLAESERETLSRALDYVRSVYSDRMLSSGEPALEHALGMAGCVAELKLDAAARVAALLFALPAYEKDANRVLESRFGHTVAALVGGISRLNELRLVTRASIGAEQSPSRASQIEALRKMLLAMVEDIRVVLLRLASRTQTLRFLAKSGAQDAERRAAVARETLDLYAPLANRLGIWQLKWELEDLSFRFLEPELYKRIAGMLDERRAERESFIARAIADLEGELAAAGLKAEITGRPKHIYSISNKMRSKGLDFSELRDVRGLRVLVDEVKDCYAALAVVHALWQPILNEFDDYIARPKENLYRSLHTAVIGPDGRPLEVQIRTREMHRTAELGVAAHWRYKEGESRARPFDEKIAMLRQMLAWRDEIVDASDWVERFKRAALDDTVYVFTPQNEVIDLPRGSTPVDFAYAVHTGLGHRCRGAKVNGAIVPLDHKLQNGDRVEIIAARAGTQASGPSRDWMNPALGYIASSRARHKVRQWFNTLALEQTTASGRAAVERELQREGRTGMNLAELAATLGFSRTEDLFAAVGREDVGQRALQLAIRGETAAQAREERAAALPETPRPPATRTSGAILVVGVDRLLTQLARCCKPVPPDPIAGFVTRGRGISIHRRGCRSFARLGERNPERIVEAAWGDVARSGGMFPVDIAIRASERPGLVRDITEVLAREQLRMSGMQSYVRQGSAVLFVTVEVNSLEQLNRTLPMLEAVRGVASAARR